MVEDVSVPSEGHRRASATEHPGDRVERDALAQGQGAGGVTQVVEADLYREAGPLEESTERAHPRVAPADLAFRVREDQTRVRPRGRRILSSSCLARCVLRISTVRGPMRILPLPSTDICCVESYASEFRDGVL